MNTASNDTNKVNALNRLAFELHSSFPRRTIQLSEEAVALAWQLSYSNGLAKAFNQKGIGYWYIGEYDSAVTFFDKALEIYKTAGNLKGQSAILNNVGNLYRIQGNFPRAIEHYQKSLKIDEELKDSNGVAISQINIGLIYKNQEEWGEALEFYRKALKSFRNLGNDFGVGVAQNNIGEVLTARGEYLKSLAYYYDAISTLDEIDAKCRIIFSELGLGDSFLFLGELDSALYHFNQALVRSEECENPFIVTQSLLGLGETTLQKGNKSSAEQYLLKAYNLASDKHFSKYVGVAAEKLSIIYESSGKLELAFQYYKIAHETNDSLFNEDKIKDLARIEYEYKIDKERTRAALEQEKNNLLFDAEIKQERLLKQRYVGISVFVIFVAIILYLQYSRQKKSSRWLEQKNQLIRKQHKRISEYAQQLQITHHTLKELSDFKQVLTHMVAHDMQNALNIILGLSNSEGEDEKMSQINRSGRLVHNLVLNMLQVQKFEEASMELKERYHHASVLIEELRKQVSVSLEMSDLVLDIKLIDDPVVHVDKDILVRVLLNLMTNAIEYSPPSGTIILRAEVQKDKPETLVISVIDQGQGISEEKLPYIFDKFWNDSSNTRMKTASIGLGLTFSKLAMEAHHGSIVVESEDGKGACFSISLPFEKEWVLNHIGPKFDFKAVEPKEEKPGQEEIGLEKFKLGFKGVEVHQIGLIYQLLAGVPESTWKKKVQSAVRQGDEEEYKKLTAL